MDVSQDDQSICQRLIADLTLSNSDRESLKKDRGFTDHVIDKLKFRSCDKSYLSTHTNELSYIKNTEFENGISYGRIIIPFFKSDGSVYYIRPHKAGIKGLGSQVYVPYPFDPDMFVKPKVLVITEGEFKAVASCMMGVPAIAVPGISSFVKEKLPTLVSILREINPRKIVICFDKEIKDDPNLPKYKSDFTKRYDTEFYSIVLAYQLTKELTPLQAKIGPLKKEWMVEGKIDIDGFLASGRNPELYRECIKNALDPYEYQKSLELSKIHNAFLNRRRDRFFYCGPIIRSFNQYYYRKKDSKVQLTNFVIRITNNIQTTDEVVRICQLISDYGESVPFQLKSEHMSSKQSFIKKCYSLGDFEYLGDDNQLRTLWTFVFKHQNGREVFELDFYGYSPEINHWIFEKGAFNNETGQYIPIDDDGIIWIDDIGYKLPDFADTGLKAPNIPKPDDKSNLDLVEIHERLSLAIQGGDPRSSQRMFGRLVLGWVIACIFMPELLAGVARDGFPFLFLYGRAASGKTTLAGWINSFFGMSMSKGVQMSSTKVGIQLACSRYSMIPLWLDEYRNTDKTMDKNDLFRNIYDRSMAIKGTRVQGKARQYPVRSTLMVSGEEYPNDHALNTRCVTVPLFFKRVEISEHFEWVEQNKEKFPQVLSNIFKKKHKIYPELALKVKRIMQKYMGEGIMNRVAKNFAIINATADYFLGVNEEFDTFILEHIKEFEKARSSEMSINVFFEDLTNSLINNETECTFACVDEMKRGEFAGREVLYVNLKSAYAAWETRTKKFRNDVPMKFDVVEKWIKTSDFYLTKDFTHARKKINGVSMRVSCILPDHPDAGTQLVNFFEAVKAKQKKNTGDIDELSSPNLYAEELF